MGRKMFVLLLISLLAISISVPMSIWLWRTQPSDSGIDQADGQTAPATRQSVLEYSKGLLSLANELYKDQWQWYCAIHTTGSIYNYWEIQRWRWNLGTVEEGIYALGSPPEPMAETIDLLLSGIDKAVAGHQELDSFIDGLIYIAHSDPYAPMPPVPSGAYYETVQMYNDAIEEWANVLSQYGISVNDITPYLDQAALDQTKLWLEGELEASLPPQDNITPHIWTQYQLRMAMIDDWYIKNRLGVGISLAFGLSGNELPLVFE